MGPVMEQSTRHPGTVPRQGQHGCHRGACQTGEHTFFITITIITVILFQNVNTMASITLEPPVCVRGNGWLCSQTTQ